MTAWETLLYCGITKLPVDLKQICHKLGIGLLSYTQGYRIIQRYGLLPALRGADGFLFRVENGPSIIFYRPEQTEGRRSFTIAHEIGHYCMGHVSIGENTLRRSGSDDPMERDADRFAAQLLAPSCVLRGLKLNSPYAIRYACRLSGRASEIAAERMRRLEARDMESMRRYGRSCFFRSPVEWRLYCQFEPFIKESLHHPDRA